MDVTDGTTAYQWRISEAFDPTDSGGSEPNDWAHLNDIEQLRDGPYVLSQRNHDQVIFVRPGEGLLESQTLASDDGYRTMYE